MASKKSKRKKVRRIFLGLSGLILLVLAIRYMASYDVPYIYKLGTNNVKFTDKYDPDATLLIPAAYSNPDHTVQGEYRIAGKIYGEPNRLERISIHPTKGLVISGRWQSNYGFQQTVLIKNNKIRYHKDKRLAFRRALGTVDGKLAILQSKVPMTLNQFSESIHKYCNNAVNLDMGDYGYGWYKRKKFSRIFKYNRDKQTTGFTCRKRKASRSVISLCLEKLFN